MAKALRVGIIGASAQRGWAKISHVPAVQGLAGLELVAVAAGDAQKAKAAVEAFGAKTGYASGLDLIQDPDVDIVSIAVKVPDHRELVLAALTAGKHIYCEWPLGKNLAEAKEMADAAKSSDSRTVIGLQMRSSAAVQQARKALSDGTIGRPLTARIISNTGAFGPNVEIALKFAEDDSNGVTLTTIQGAHTFDLCIAVLGPFASLAALGTTQYPRVQIGEEKTETDRTTYDHIFLHGTLESGVPLGLEVAGGRPPQAPTHLEITGTDGVLALHGGAMRGVQSGRLELRINDQPVRLDEGEIASMPETAVNVAGIYAMLRDDILHGTRTAPDFDHAVKLTRFVGAVLTSSRQQAIQQSDDWPTQ